MSFRWNTDAEEDIEMSQAEEDTLRQEGGHVPSMPSVHAGTGARTPPRSLRKRPSWRQSLEPPGRVQMDTESESSHGGGTQGFTTNDLLSPYRSPADKVLELTATAPSHRETYEPYLRKFIDWLVRFKGYLDQLNTHQGRSVLQKLLKNKDIPVNIRSGRGRKVLDIQKDLWRALKQMDPPPMYSPPALDQDKDTREDDVLRKVQTIYYSESPLDDKVRKALE